MLRYDSRGHGQSDAPKEPYSLDRFGYDTLEMLDQVGIEQVHIVGLSLGGLVAQWLAIHAPERVGKLVIVSSASFLPGRKQHDEFIKKVRAAKGMSNFAAMLVQNWFPKDMISDNDVRIKPFKHDLLEMNPQCLAGSLAVVRDTDLRRPVSLITALTLIIGSQYDVVTQLKFSEELAASIPNAQLEVLPATLGKCPTSRRVRTVCARLSW